MNIKKYLSLPALMISLIMLSGCANLSTGKNYNELDSVTAENFEPVATINAYNYGYYLFGWVPIITGDASTIGHTALFKDDATIGNMANLVTETSKKLGGTRTVNMQSTRYWTGGFSLWIIWFKEVNVSANAIKPKPTEHTIKKHTN